ncbi:MAG: hypothetical protein FJ404_14535 [Verrucomicrobia bacterium]|nr:hypothetical protein [Verrucomicrobiota bacterium]
MNHILSVVQASIANVDPSLVAHEVGHALGLQHPSPDTDNKRLMHASGVGIIDISNVAPDGAGYFTINASEKTTLLASRFVTVVPEPAETALATGIGLGLFFLFWKRKQSRSLEALKA